jgi:predicted nuclease of predicted toxin-antitoxin system
MHKFLIDECLSPQLAGVAREYGCFALHVNWLSRSGYSDRSHAAFALAEEMILVTNDGADYSAIYRAIDLHPGLVVILPVVKRPIQQSLFRAVVERLVMERDVINKLIEIDEEGAITISEFPPFRDNI